MVKRAVIVGAGPAGLGAAYRLAIEGKHEITLIEQGKSALERKCPSPNECVHCNRKTKLCDKGEGVGGAGSFADGKFIGPTEFGDREVGSNMGEYVGSREIEREIINAGTNFWKEYGVSFDAFSEEKLKKAKQIERIARQNDIGYILSSQTHIGTDKLPQLIAKIEQDLRQRGVNILTQERITDYTDTEVVGEKGTYKYDDLILTSGRKGADWLENILKKHKVQVGYREVDIGFRVETDAAVLQELCDVSRDVKLSLRVPGNGTLVRTFCVCPNGYVGRETYEKAGFNLVNGESHSDPAMQSPNSNFALLVSVDLIKKANCNSYSDSIAKTFYWAGTDQPVVQRLGDLTSSYFDPHLQKTVQISRRSKEEKLPEFRIKPTLKDVFVGNVGIAMPYWIVQSLLYGIDRLSVPGLMQGLNQYSTLLYAPEMKRNGLKVKADEYFQVQPKVYIAGDGPGLTRGIVAASASGIRAAEGILR